MQFPPPPPDLDRQDVVWTTPSKDAAGSAPIGNGEVVLNVWVEDETGDLLFTIARTDALSEISRILKLGRVRVHFTPTPFLGPDFRQRLSLRDGAIAVSGGGAKLVLFVDSGADVVHLTGGFAKATQVQTTVECWRNEARALPKAEERSAWSVHDAPFPLVESADVFLHGRRSPGPGAPVVWYHRNETSVVPKLWANQSLTGAPGRYDPLLHRTFGGMAVQHQAGRTFDLAVATASAQTKTAGDWVARVRREMAKSPIEKARSRTRDWWRAFWGRSWVFVEGDRAEAAIPANDHPLRKGLDSNGQNVFPGTIDDWRWSIDGAAAREDHPTHVEAKKELRLQAEITPTELKPGRIFDKLTAGREDGFLFDTYPGDGLRLIVGGLTLTAPHCLTAGKTATVEAIYSASTGEASIILDGKRVAHRAPETGSPITRGYTLQRYVQACQGRGVYPIKFNGGYYTVAPVGKPFDPDWRNWGDCHWWQNVRHMYHPMLPQGDFEMMDSLWRLYEAAVPLAESRTKLYHQARGVYFPETMTTFGTYSGGDYGWDRTGHQPNEVLCPWWQYAWNQGPELVALMLDRWDFTRDEPFLTKRVLPMAEQVLLYFDTRFQKVDGRIVLDPTQSAETYWTGVVNDMPTTAGLIAITTRLGALPPKLVPARLRKFFAHMKAACPTLPIRDGRLQPAQKFDPTESNVENPELYAVWPFRLITATHRGDLGAAVAAYRARKNHLDVGWGYDGNVAALLGLTDEAARILRVKCANSNPAYRWPASWGPNFDWIPDQNHGGNLLETTDLMLLQSDSIEDGGKIYLLPAWPKAWDVDFKLHARGNAWVHCRTRDGKIVLLQVEPKARLKDVVRPPGW